MAHPILDPRLLSPPTSQPTLTTLPAAVGPTAAPHSAHTRSLYPLPLFALLPARYCRLRPRGGNAAARRPCAREACVGCLRLRILGSCRMAESLKTKEELREYLASADLQEVLRSTLSPILKREDLPTSESLVRTLGEELLKISEEAEDGQRDEEVRVATLR